MAVVSIPYPKLDAGHPVSMQTLALAMNHNPYILLHMDGWVQERRNSIANAMELPLSCTDSSIWDIYDWGTLAMELAQYCTIPSNLSFNGVLMLYTAVYIILSLIQWPSDTIWCHRTLSPLVQAMTCHLFSNKPFLHQCWLSVNWAPRNKLKWYFEYLWTKYNGNVVY